MTPAARPLVLILAEANTTHDHGVMARLQIEVLAMLVREQNSTNALLTKISKQIMESGTSG